MTLAPGVRLGPYEILAPLWRGGMGDVWRARDARLWPDVAITPPEPETLRDVVTNRREGLAYAML